MYEETQRGTAEEVYPSFKAAMPSKENSLSSSRAARQPAQKPVVQEASHQFVSRRSCVLSSLSL